MKGLLEGELVDLLVEVVDVQRLGGKILHP